MRCCGNKRCGAGPLWSASRRAGLVRPAVLVIALALTSCSRGTLSDADARRLLEESSRFSAPDVVRVLTAYCSTVEPPGTDTSSGLGRLEALADAGAIRIERRAAAPNECTSLTGMKERLTIALADAAASFHPRPLEANSGWEFTLGQRRIVSMDPLTYNREDDPTLARVTYRWAWRADLLGQLLELSEEPVNAQATFIRADGEWTLRDPGF